MKPIFATVPLALVLLSSMALAQSSGTSDVKSEFLRWKASAAGKQAYDNGFLPGGSSSKKWSIASVGEPTPEELARFQSSMETVERLQKEQPHAVFSVDTPFALLTPDEFGAYVKKSGVQEHLKELEKLALPPSGFASNFSASRNLEASSTVTATVARDLKAETTWNVNVDWQTKGCVTDIKNQGGCGVCWAFAATAALESGYCALKGSLYTLSEQDIVSCSRATASCDGGFAAMAYDWMTRENGGSLCTAASYPYASADGVAPSCKRFEDPNFKCDKPNLGAYFYGGGHFPDHTQLEAAVLRQPVATSVHAGVPLFQYYKTGVLMGDNQACSADTVDHEVLVVGFGTRDGIPYWKVKNQWSTAWGDNGYWYIERGFQGHTYGACGIEYYGYYPIFPPASDPGLNKRTTTPLYGYGIVGTTLKTISGALKIEECGDRCRQEPECKGYNWKDHFQCELKSTFERLENAAVSYGKVISKEESLKQCLAITDNVDYPGNDVKTSLAASAEECCDHCNQRTECNAFTWTKFNGGSCYMKSVAPGKPVTSPTLPDGSAYFRSGISYRCTPLQANTDRVGGDIGNVASTTAANCCGICRSTTGCYTFAWTDYNGGTCWLKGPSSKETAVVGVTSGKLF